VAITSAGTGNVVQVSKRKTTISTENMNQALQGIFKGGGFTLGPHGPDPYLKTKEKWAYTQVPNSKTDQT